MVLKQKSCRSFFLLITILLLLVQSIYGQIRSGAAFLKMLPGARVQAMAAAHTGGVEEVYAMYANPGAAGFLREWQWSVSYNRWIADVNNASLFYARNLRTPWSRKTRIAVGLLYYGVPEFDSSDGAAPNASANDIVSSLSFGQPLSFISDNIALGTNIKYLKSTLDQYNAGSLIVDVGLLARTPRFNLKNSLFEHGILSAGIALTQMGKNLEFDQVGTPLPRTLRVGMSFYAGTHNGIQMQILADYHNVRDEGGAFGVGTEFSWSRKFSVNGGYDFNSDLMSHVSFGVSIRLDDIITSEHAFLPGRNNALQFDLATLDEGEFFSRTYRGSVTHLPIAPENFRFIEPAMGDSLTNKQAVLKWEQSRDPDLYDDIQYTFLLDRDRTRIVNMISLYDNKETAKFISALSDSSFLLRKELEVDSLQVNNLASGHYYWAVVASDMDQHFRFAELDNRRIANFYLPYPDIEIKNIVFEYSPWITQDDYHGELKISFTNIGQLAARNFYISIYDSLIDSHRIISNHTQSEKKLSSQLAKKHIEVIKPGETQTIQIPWHTSLLGFHKIIAVLDIDQTIEENNEENNKYSQNFYTIPKGKFTCDDTVTAVLVSQVSIDMPIITEISFDTNSAQVKSEYLHKTLFDPPIAILAERLSENSYLTVSLKGFADKNSNEMDVILANDRAAAVRDALIRFGASEEQIQILPGEVLEKRRVPSNPQDAKWVFEERRYVKITSNQDGQSILFQPVRHVDNEELPKNVYFKSEIKSTVPVNKSWISCLHKDLSENILIQNVEGQLDIQRELEWNKIPSSWLLKDVSCYINLSDTLGRSFRTHDRQTYLNKSVFQREHRIAFPLKFARTDPMYDFYWAKLLDIVKKLLADPNKRICFTGHACAIGPENVNKRLSKQRASRFHQGFISYVKSHDKEYLKQMLKKLDPSKGFGESKPLCVDRLSGEQILIGNNATPLGRKLNRRIEVVFSTTGFLMAHNSN